MALRLGSTEYSATEHMYVTHATATHRSLRVGVGVGLFLRKQQLRLLAQRIDPTRGGPVEVVSLSANADTRSPGAVEFQRHVFTQKLGFEEVEGALLAIQRIAAAKPELSLDRVMEQDVTPLRFRKSEQPATIEWRGGRGEQLV